jgi:hypothetical protein
MLVTASPQARALIRDRGGRLFVWATSHRCCGGALTLLDSATEPPSLRPGARFERIDADGFTLFLAVGRRAGPEELVVAVRGRRRPRIDAFWNGCAYVA